MFNQTVTKILETIAFTPHSTTPLTRGPDVNWVGATPAGFKGDSFNSAPIQVKVRKKKKKINKRV